MKQCECNATLVILAPQGREKCSAMNKCLILSALDTEDTQRNTHSCAGKWAIPAKLLVYQGHKGITFAPQRRLSKRGHKHNHNSSKCRHFYNAGGTGVRQFLPSQGAVLGWWPLTVAWSAVASTRGVGSVGVGSG